MYHVSGLSRLLTEPLWAATVSLLCQSSPTSRGGGRESGVLKGLGLVDMSWFNMLVHSKETRTLEELAYSLRGEGRSRRRSTNNGGLRVLATPKRIRPGEGLRCRVVSSSG